MAHLKLDKQFIPETLAARRDVTEAMVGAASGHFEVVSRCLQEDERELHATNRDGNNLLLLAVVNQHTALVKLLFEAKADLRHRNARHMDALDYAVIDGVQSPLAKVVLSHYDYLVPEILEGPYLAAGNQAVEALENQGLNLIRCNLIGKTPLFSDPGVRETEFCVEWFRGVNFLAATIKKGFLLLSNEVGYLERDANLTGILDVPARLRYVYVPTNGHVMKYPAAFRQFYAVPVDRRILAASSTTDRELVQCLLKASARPNVETAKGETALMRAAQTGDPAVLGCLLKARAVLDARSPGGYTALFMAAGGGKESAVRLLIRANADSNLKSYKNHSILDIVKHQGLKHIHKAILEERVALQKELIHPGKRRTGRL